ncbi:hypothetical protein [Morganella morganii]|uniref:hypothetical protein n=1 Tax=Morganella morganii TaxID=582 RepID=UPI00069B09D9|nr:hypothetical protein [Morganella morganii]KNZ83875.1 hypothetical protein AKG16_19015 [Morganella morganii]
MLKKLAFVTLLTPALCMAIPEHSGLYRDANFNLDSYQGAYLCKIYPLPKDVSDYDGYSDEVIGEANVTVENQEGGTGKMVFVGLNNGKDINTPILSLAEKGSSRTIYGYKSNSFLMVYVLTNEDGVNIAIQSKKKGEELSVYLGNCTLLRSHDHPTPADP